MNALKRLTEPFVELVVLIVIMVVVVIAIGAEEAIGGGE